MAESEYAIRRRQVKGGRSVLVRTCLPQRAAGSHRRAAHVSVPVVRILPRDAAAPCKAVLNRHTRVIDRSEPPFFCIRLSIVGSAQCLAWLLAQRGGRFMPLSDFDVVTPFTPRRRDTRVASGRAAADGRSPTVWPRAATLARISYFGWLLLRVDATAPITAGKLFVSIRKNLSNSLVPRPWLGWRTARMARPRKARAGKKTTARRIGMSTRPE
jgi:hypothetical protein